MSFKFTFVLPALIFLSTQVQALEIGCQLHPSELNKKASAAVENFYKKESSLPDSLVLTSDFEFEQNQSKESLLVGTLEGFYRPAQSDNYALTPLPFLTVPLNREEHVVYVCAHYENDPTKTHVTIYLMRGSKLDPLRFGNALGNLLRKPSLQVKPLSFTLIDFKKIKKDFLPIFKWIPVIDWGIVVTDTVQQSVLRAITDMAKVGVERITVTSTGIELATGVDLKNPRKALIKKTISF